MNNKLIFSLYDKAIKEVSIETVIDIINLYGNKCIDGIEVNSENLEFLTKCAKICKKNGLLFRCHFPIYGINESDTIKLLNCLNEISKDLRYNINVVFHSQIEQDTIEEKIEATKEYIEKIINYISKYDLNLTVSLENLNFRHAIKRINVSKIDKILNCYEKLAFTYDIGHDLYDNKIPSKLSKLQKEKINNVHIHSILKSEDHHEINKNSKDITEIKNAMLNLKQANYNGPIVLEYAIDYFDGNRTEEKIINYVKSFKFFKEEIVYE